MEMNNAITNPGDSPSSSSSSSSGGFGKKLLSSLSNAASSFLGNTPFGIANSFLNHIFSGMARQQEFEYKKQYFDYTFGQQADFQREMVKSDRAYNDPTQVARRLYEAGVNPYAGNGSSPLTAGMSPSAAPGGSPGESTGFAGGTSTLTLDPLSAAQADLIRAQANKIRAETPGEGQTERKIESSINSLDAQTQNLVSQTDLNEFKLSLETELRQVRIDSARAEYDNLVRTGDVLISQAAHNNASAAQLTDLLLSQAQDRALSVVHMKLLEAQTDMTKAQADKFRAELPLIEQQIATLFSQELLNFDKGATEQKLQELLGAKKDRLDKELEFLPYLLSSEIFKNTAGGISDILDTWFHRNDAATAADASGKRSDAQGRSYLTGVILQSLLKYYMSK